jgi:hypothetical protein
MIQLYFKILVLKNVFSRFIAQKYSVSLYIFNIVSFLHIKHVGSPIELNVQQWERQRE